MSIEKFLKIFSKRERNRFPYRYYLEKNKCIFIHIPKVAGTSILRALGKKEAFGRDHTPWYVYKKFDKRKFEEYYKFSFVRNPWDRTYSAYRYLREGGNGKEDLYLQEKILKFTDFNDFIVNGFQNGLLRNHQLFIPQSEFVVGQDQQLVVDFLGRYENLNKDFAVVAKHLGIYERLEKLNVSTSASDEAFSEESVEIIRLVYAQDVEFFGYQYNP